ncbi:helix-hairpin-helix domain-containing protein [Pedobacter sp. MW01-1-1]|uniref:helix-hairpin-helix domain-containing protein n=1 Tax=Pedobacter sp. MW01-1-1 TaxID=3383027 RepID=UPI003FEDE255
MHFRLFTLLLVLLGFCSTVLAQNPDEEVNIRDIVESVSEVLPDDYDMIELVDALTRLRKHPIDLNTATADDLKRIIFLSPLQISNFITYRKDNGRVENILELQVIDGFDTNLVQNLLPFVTVNTANEYEKLTFKNALKNSDNDLIMRYASLLEQQKGFTDLPQNRYLGSPSRFLGRYRYYFGNILSAALTVEKDAGEKFFGKPTDFISGNITLAKLGKISKLIVGDYSLQFGQGLTMWAGFSFGKGPDVTSVVKKDMGLRPYTSANEYSFLRGTAATVLLSTHLKVTPFVSFRKLDANQLVDANGELVQSTINQSGLHRTPSEIKNKATLGQQVYGAVLEYTKQELAIGFIGFQTKFSNKFITKDAVYDQFSFTGKSLINTGVYSNYTYRNVYLYGEAGYSLNGSLAYTGGALISLSPIVSMAVAYRNYPKNYTNFFNQAMAESSEATNEKGLYTGLNIIPNKRWAFSFYGDYFKFPWLKYRVDAPSGGYELFAQAIFSPKKTLKFIARFKSESKQQNTDEPVLINYLDDVKKEGYRFDVNWQLNKRFSFQNRLECSQYRKGNNNSEFGYLIYQDASYSPMFSKITGNIRLAYFNTPSYNSRIYAYEDDVLYSFAFGMYNGKGLRSYLNIKYKLAKKLSIWLRYALFSYQDVQTVGNYLDEIQGNKKSEIKTLIRYQF